MSLLDRIQSPEDVKALSEQEIPQLCRELRAFLVKNVAQTGGHLASNLGVVELTVAIHRVYDTSKDRLLFDVGHQSYIHKILTGRKEQFSSLRQYGGIAGFPKPKESAHDAFVAGHASTSISAALGMARARTLKRDDYDVLAVIGDGALTGGLAYEGLSDAGQSGEPMVIILNDNGMSIHKNVGGMATLLSKQRVMPGYLRLKQVFRETVGKVKPLYRALHHVKENVKDSVLPDNMFDDMGFYYIGPVDGHNEPELERILRWAKDIRQPVLLHVVTQKGRGISYTEREPEKYHGVGRFDAKSGELPPAKPCFSDAASRTLMDLAETHPELVAITAAMASGTGLDEFACRYPDRFFDVGIAEEHAVTMASAMAKQGLIPVFAVYSSFLQRSYDMLIHDTALQRLHVVLCVDRAGIVGNDGDTHNGCFDVSYLSSVPGMTIMAPASFAELEAMLRCAVDEMDGPVAVRYPRGGEGSYHETHTDPVTFLRTGANLTIVSYGVNINDVLEAAERLGSDGIFADVVKLGTICPLDAGPILESLRKTGHLLVLEETCDSGSVGQTLLAQAQMQGVCLKNAKLLNLGDGIVPHGDVQTLRHVLGLDAEAVVKAAHEMLKEQDA